MNPAQPYLDEVNKVTAKINELHTKREALMGSVIKHCNHEKATSGVEAWFCPTCGQDNM